MKFRTVGNYIVFAFLLIGAVALFFRPPDVPDAVPTAETAEAEDVPETVFVIDAGHGGEDGGATVDGVSEKDINLSVSLKTADLCTLFGYGVRLTRTDDRLLYDEYGDLTDYSGKKKTYDLKNRLRIAEESNAKLFIGIHMNKFPEERYHGLQVWYSPNNEKSSLAAEYIRAYAKTNLDPSNERETKAAGKSIYILNRIKLPAVLVECGFLSNGEERAKLVTPEYQSHLAAVIFASGAEYTAAN